MIPVPPPYKVTSEMLEYVSKVEANLIYLSSLSIPGDLKDKIRRVSILKSSLFSARIEGNTLTYERIDREDDNSDEKKEVFNIYNAVEILGKSEPQKVSLKTILNLHSKVLEGLSPDAGIFRTESSAIFNAAGEVVYITPAPDKIPGLLKQMLAYSNGEDEKFPLINTFVSHLIFEKTHPFIDGNGRVGRLLVFVILKSKEKDLPFFIPFEEYLDEHKSEYYYHLDHGLKNTNDYLLFMLGAYYVQTEKIKQLVTDEMEGEHLLLTPRQEEIYNIIKDHRIVSLDEIKRRFMAVPKRTLSFDLKKLMDQGLVVKIGKTKGSYYRLEK